MEVFHVFKLYKWHQSVQSTTNFPYFDPCRLMNEINSFHDVQKKIDNSVSVNHNELTISYNGIIEIKWNNFRFFQVILVKKAPMTHF